LLALGGMAVAADSPRIEEVTLSGNLGVKPADLRKALKATRTKTMIPGLWHLRPEYTATAVDDDLARLRSYYYQRGFFAASVKLKSSQVSEGSARIDFTVDSGPRYRPRNPVSFCGNLLEERRRAERTGIVDFTARLDVSGPPDAAVLSTSTHQGLPVRVGRIDFHGDHRFADTALRRTLLIEEEGPLDAVKLRKSLARLSATGWFEPFTASSVEVRPGDGDHANVTIHVQEKKARNWFLSGPVGPMSIAGPLEFSIGARLPPWGRGLLELSTYTLSANLMLFAKPIGQIIPFFPNRRFLSIVSLQRPLLPGQTWTSGLTVAPQYGGRGMAAGYVMSHARALLDRSLSSDRPFSPDLPVTITREGRPTDGAMMCEPPKAKLDWVKQITGTAVNLAFSFSPF
jgi:outer membrane protein insertion porin family